MFKKAYFTGRISKWGAKISALDMKYLLRTAIKGQVLSDFVAEFTLASGQVESNIPVCYLDLVENTRWWRLYVDRASNAKGARTRVVIITSNDTVTE